MLNNKTAIITGAASGIGFATARLFVENGARVVLADIDASAVQSAAAQLGHGCLGFAVDVSNSSEVAALAQKAAETFDRLDILVNNAGFGFTGNVQTISEVDWDRLIAVNLKSVFLCSKMLIPLMVFGGSIVNTTSYTATAAIADRTAYVASKGGISSLTRAMALDHAAQNIRVNAVAPGTINSPYFDKIFAASADPDALRQQFNGRSPMGRMGRPEEIAEAIMWLASDRSSFATGSVLTVDGGSSIW